MNKLLRDLREALQKSQREMAQDLAVSPQNWSNYEAGKSPLPQTVMQKLVALFRVNPAWLVMGEGDMFGSGAYSFGETLEGEKKGDIQNATERLVRRLEQELEEAKERERLLLNILSSYKQVPLQS